MTMLTQVLVSCPSCKQIEFLPVVDGNKIDPHSAYHQKDEKLYHKDCPEPCRLFSMAITPLNLTLASTNPRND
jgi:hypothetical protein